MFWSDITNKKKIILVLIVIFIISVSSLLGMMIYNNLTNYANVLKANWNIELPKNLIEEIYSADEGASFHGDGIRYHIFSYKNEDKIEELFDWSIEEKETKDYSTYSETIDNWLNEIKVSKENYPNYSNCKYWYNKKDDNSEIIILWDSKENRLYIVESFL